MTWLTILLLLKEEKEIISKFIQCYIVFSTLSSSFQCEEKIYHDRGGRFTHSTLLQLTRNYIYFTWSFRSPWLELLLLLKLFCIQWTIFSDLSHKKKKRKNLSQKYWEEEKAHFPEAVKNWNQVLGPKTLLIFYVNFIFFNLKFRISNHFKELVSHAFYLQIKLYNHLMLSLAKSLWEQRCSRNWQFYTPESILVPVQRTSVNLIAQASL